MIELDLTLLNQSYAQRLNWYPTIVNPQQPAQRIKGVADILDKIDLVLLDSYGVLCRGAVAIEGAVDAIAQIRASNTPLCVVSNDTMTNRRVAAEKYQQRGFDFAGEEVITSLDMTEKWLEKIDQPERWGYIGPQPHPSDDLLKGMVNLTACDGIIPAEVDHLLFLVSLGWTEQMQHNLNQSAQGKQFTLVAGNPDMGAPYATDQGIKVGATPGYFMHQLVAATNQQAIPLLHGKPGQTIFEAAAKQFEVTDPSRVLMVGDTLYTDILGGNAMGFKTLLLECGIYQGLNIEQLISESGISPDFIAPQL